MEVAIPIPRALPSLDAQKRLGRLHSLAWFLDQSIPIGRRWRIGIDPLIGLLPGAGDWIGALLSVYVLYEAARLGLPLRVLARMAGNILVEATIGAIPLVGDLFDFAWKANAKNVALIDEHFRPALRGGSLRKLWAAMAAFAIVLLTISGVLVYFALKAVAALLGTH